MKIDLIINLTVFFVGIAVILCWQPTRVLLKEIIFRPLQDSRIEVVPDEEEDCRPGTVDGARKGSRGNTPVILPR